MDVVGDVRNCLSLARSLFVDEIFFSVPGEKKMVISMVEEARAAGIDVRVVPDLYDGLAWNAPVEYIGQFPTIPLHRRDFPIGAFLLKRTLDITLSLLALLVASPVLLAIMHCDQDGFGRVYLVPGGSNRPEGADLLLLQISHDGGERGQVEGRSGAYE